ncbi:MAG TPA: VWA domain-containing protein [Vicinamibacterales bacterium]|nr:VWA domain-containing protein [Vicinamibacterales bacterium]
MRYSRFLVLAICLALTATTRASSPEGPVPLGVRITSPLGRTGQPGTVRIVAQIHAENTLVKGVRFFVDGKLLKESSDGPPYATEWNDDNPFQQTEITVQAWDDHGNSALDKVVLKPVEVQDETHVGSVLLEASVQDKTGRFISGLAAKDFRVSEDGQPQTLELTQQEEVPSNLAVLVDSSQSMSRRVDFVREAAQRLASYMRPKDRMLVVPFSRHLGPITGPTDDKKTVGEAVAAIAPKGGTAIMDSLIELSAQLKPLPGRNAIVLITDGYDENSEQNVGAALQACKDAQATVYVVGIGGVAGISIKGQRVLKQIADATGGRLFLPAREEQLPAIHELIADDVQHRYMVTYTPKNQELDGRWRKISLETTKPDYVVHTRPGYFAPAPPPVKPSIEFTITDKDEKYLNVEASDLTVIEDGVEQKIDTFQEAVAPVSIVLALDESGSMKKAAEGVQDAARRFVSAVRPQDKLGLVLFADHSTFAHDLSLNRDHTLAGIDQYKASGGTALYDALSDALHRLKFENARRVVVVLTDGRDEDNPGKGPGSTHTFDDVLEYAKETDAIVFGIGLGPNVDAAVLEKLADVTGGEAYFPSDTSSLDATYQRIVENLRRRWIVSYTSTNSHRDGAWRNVVIGTRFPDVTVRSKGGYFAPTKQQAGTTVSSR